MDPTTTVHDAHTKRRLRERDLFIARLAKEGEHPDFQIGDEVTYTNDQGVVFPGHIIIGFSRDILPDKFVHIDTDCYWMPKRYSNLVITKKNDLIPLG